MKKTFAIALLSLSACVSSYSGRAPLRYAELPYTGLDGNEWNEQYLQIPDTAARLGLAADTSICYVELNAKGRAPLVFIHGLGSYLKFWRYQLDEFAKRGHRVIAIDMVGYGKSDKPARFPYTMEAMADVVREVVESLGVQDPILIGHSMGGQTALSYAIRYPDALRALVLTSPAGFETFSVREQRWFEAVFSTALVSSTSELGVWRSIRANNFARWRDELEWLIEERVRLGMGPDFGPYAYANVRSVRGLAHNDFVRNNLDKITVPALIIHGEADRLIPNPFMHGGETRAVMERGHAAIKDSKLVSLERCGHMIQMDCPREYNSELVRFFDAELGVKLARRRTPAEASKPHTSARF